MTRSSSNQEKLLEPNGHWRMLSFTRSESQHQRAMSCTGTCTEDDLKYHDATSPKSEKTSLGLTRDWRERQSLDIPSSLYEFHSRPLRQTDCVEAHRSSGMIVHIHIVDTHLLQYLQLYKSTDWVYFGTWNACLCTSYTSLRLSFNCCSLRPWQQSSKEYLCSDLYARCNACSVFRINVISVTVSH